MEPLQLFAALRRYWPMLIVGALLGAVGGFAYWTSTPATYRSTASVFVTATGGDTTNEIYQGARYSQDVVQSFAEVAKTPEVLDPVIERLGLDTTAGGLANRLTVSAALETVIIDVTASARSGADAATLAQAVAEQLIVTADGLAPANADGASALRFSIIAPAQTPTSPSSTSRSTTIAGGGVAGLALGALLAVVLGLVDNRIRSERDLTSFVDAPLLGRIPLRRGRVSGPSIAVTPRGREAEEYRRLRTNLSFMQTDEPVTAIAVTSSIAGEGKSTTAINLALALAENTKRVLLIDADLRKPSIAPTLGVDDARGLSDVLVGRAKLRESIQLWGDVGLQVLPAGTIPPNPHQLLSSAAFAALLENVRSVYDVVVVDLPPLLPVVDALSVAPLCDGTVVVVQRRRTRRAELRQTLHSLEMSTASLFGLVLNRAANTRNGDYYGSAGDPGQAVAPVARIARLRAPARPAPRTRAVTPKAAAPADEPTGPTVDGPIHDDGPERAASLQRAGASTASPADVERTPLHEPADSLADRTPSLR